MSRILLRSTQYLLDAIIVAGSFIAAFLLRFDGDLPDQMIKRLVFLLPYVVGIRLAATGGGLGSFWATVMESASGQI